MSRPSFLRAVATGVVSCLLAGGAVAQQPRLIDAEPFDRLTLKENSENKKDESKRILKLRPLEMKKRRPLEPGEEDERIRLRLFDREELQYEVAWRTIDKLELYEELVLAEVAGLVEQKQFDEAYEYFLFLEARDPQFPGVAAGFQNCLFAEAAKWRELGDLDQALALLNEVHRRNAEFAELETSLGEVVDAAIEKRLAAGQYAAVRELLKDLEKKFKQHPVVAQRKKQVIDQAAEQLATAKAAAKTRKLREAYIAASKAVDWWPELPGAKTLLGQIQERYRVLTVGVADLGEARVTSAGTRQADAWAARRQRRLTDYNLAEPVAGAASGAYRSALGTWAMDGARWSFTLHENARWSGGERVTAHDVVRRLQSLADPTSADWAPQWNEQVVDLRVPAENRVEIDMRGPRPDALAMLQTPPLSWRAAANAPDGTGVPQPGTGLYALASRGEGEAVFQINPEHFAYEPSQANEIVERRFVAASAAVAALLAGDIVCVDRIAPWDLPQFTRHANLTVSTYARRTEHALVANPRRALSAELAFRRGISSCLQPKLILAERIFEGETGQTADLASMLPPEKAYDPRLALAQLSAAQRAAGLADGPLALTLAHPATEVARRAVRSIQEQLRLGGLGPVVTLRELDYQPRDAGSGDWDLLYVEWPNFDLLTDQRRLLGSDGFVGVGSPWIDDLLRGLGEAESNEQLQARRAALGQSLLADLTVIPLWYLPESFAYRKSLTNVGAQPVTLYEQIEKWKYEQK